MTLPGDDADLPPSEPGSTTAPGATPRLRHTGWTLAALAAGTAVLWSGLTVGVAMVLLPDATTALRVGPVLSWTVLVALGALGLNAWAVARTARYLNRPLAALSQATLRLRDGAHGTRLDEGDGDPEMRTVHAGFNRVAREIEHVEHDRALMLAGLSHDLRTPLARLRLEAELSVPDAQARAHIAQDIDTLDRLIGKFADYARPGQRTWEPVPLRLAVEHAVATFDVATATPAPDGVSRPTAQEGRRLRLEMDVDPSLTVMGDATEMLRVLRNLLQNATRHGRAPGAETAWVAIRARRHGVWVDLVLRDHGPGVPAAQLTRLTVPFFRGDAARTDTPGAGLGLAIVAQAVRRMDGSVRLRNAADGGLVVQLRLLAGPDAVDRVAACDLKFSAAGRARRPAG